jgi:hypothetical protein
MARSTQEKMRKTLERIAAEHLGIETLEARKRDSLDFHEVSVWGVKAALEAACDAALDSAEAYRATAIEVRDSSVITTWALAANDLDSARERAREQAARRGYCSDIFVRVEPID